MQVREQRNVPRTFTCCMRSKRFISVASVPVRLIALALFTRMSMPPKAAIVAFTAAVTWSSKRMSATQATALPPAASISRAASCTVPGSFG